MPCEVLFWPVWRSTNDALCIQRFKQGGKNSLKVCTLTAELSRLGLNPNTAINCHPDVFQAGSFIKVCAVPQRDVKLGVLSTGISWWMLKIPVPYLKSRWVIYLWQAEQIPNSCSNLQGELHRICSTVTPPANDAARIHMLHTKEE